MVAFVAIPDLVGDWRAVRVWPTVKGEIVESRMIPQQHGDPTWSLRVKYFAENGTPYVTDEYTGPLDIDGPALYLEGNTILVHVNPSNASDARVGPGPRVRSFFMPLLMIASALFIVPRLIGTIIRLRDWPAPPSRPMRTLQPEPEPLSRPREDA